MEYITKRTNELTPSELEGILLLFNEIFEKERTLIVLLNQYKNNVLGYSFHTIVKENERVIAHIADIPCYYYAKNNKVLFSDAVDAFVLKEYRDASVLIELLMIHRDYLKKNGVLLELGFPNKYAMKVYKKGKLFTKIGEMRTYILPYRIGGIKSGLRFFNFISKTFCFSWVGLNSLFASKKENNFLYKKDDESYNQTRYLRMDGSYRIIKDDGNEFYYKIMEYEGIRTAFIIDVVGKSSYNFNKAVRYILKHEKTNFDMILYVGNIYTCAHGLIKIPSKIEPKEFNFAIKILDKSIKCDELIDISNWDVNLSNYDLL